MPNAGTVTFHTKRPHVLCKNTAIQKNEGLIVTAMLTRLLAALLLLLALGVLAAWAWDRSDTDHQAAAIATHTTPNPHAPGSH